MAVGKVTISAFVAIQILLNVIWSFANDSNTCFATINQQKFTLIKIKYAVIAVESLVFTLLYWTMNINIMKILCETIAAIITLGFLATWISLLYMLYTNCQPSTNELLLYTPTNSTIGFTALWLVLAINCVWNGIINRGFASDRGSPRLFNVSVKYKEATFTAV